MKDELYINGKFIELSEIEPVGFTYQVYDIAQMEPQAAYSNQFQIPQTNNNNIALNFSNQVQTNTKAPYRKLPATFIRGGIQIVSNGFAIIDGYAGSYMVTIYSSVFDFFNQLGELSLQDIDWSELNHLYVLDEIKTRNTKYLTSATFPSPDNVCWPIINWGGYFSNKPIDIKYQMPCINFAYILKKIFKKTTYKAKGLIFSDGLFNDMAMTLSPEATGVTQDLLTARSMKASSAYNPYFNYFLQSPGINMNRISLGIISITSLLGIFRITNSFDDFNSTAGAFHKDTVNPVLKLTARVFDPLTLIPAGSAIKNTRTGPIVFENEPPLNQSSYVSSWYQTISIKCHIWHRPNILDDKGSLLGAYIYPTYIILKNGIQIYEIGIDTFGGPLVLFEDEFECSVTPGDEIKLVVTATTFEANYAYLGNHSYISITAVDSLLFNSILKYNSLVPDLKLKDIIRCFCQQFALIIKPEGNTVLFTEFREIKQNIDNGEDWSNKLDLTQQLSITYRIANYARVNNLKWKADALTKGFGDSSFSIDDNVLEKFVDIFEMIYPSALAFNNIKQTISQPSSGNTGVKIPRFTLIQADNWITTANYSMGDIVNYGGVIYTAFTPSFDTIPVGNPSVWIKNPVQYTQSESTDSRLVLIRSLGKTGDNENITYTDGENNLDIDSKKCLIAWFADPAQTYQLNFNYLIPTYWREFVQMLARLKVVECYMNLSDLDILELDFLTLKYIGHFDNDFYLNVVEEYLQGQSTKCRLIRM